MVVVRVCRHYHLALYIYNGRLGDKSYCSGTHGCLRLLFLRVLSVFQSLLISVILYSFGHLIFKQHVCTYVIIDCKLFFRLDVLP